MARGLPVLDDSLGVQDTLGKVGNLTGLGFSLANLVLFGVSPAQATVARDWGALMLCPFVRVRVRSAFGAVNITGVAALLAVACAGASSPSPPPCPPCPAGLCFSLCNPDGTIPTNPIPACVFPDDGGSFHVGAPDGATVQVCQGF